MRSGLAVLSWVAAGVAASCACVADGPAWSQSPSPPPNSSARKPFVLPDPMKALSPLGLNPPDVDGPTGPAGAVEFVPDRVTAEKDGFVMDTMEGDHDQDPMREVVGREFVAAIGRTVGREMPLNFSYDLMDLTGSGFNSLILWPRIYQLFPKDSSTGEPVYVYDFDGKEWHLAVKADAVMLGVRPQFGADGKPTGAMDLAMVHGDGYDRFVYDKGKDEWHEAPKR